MAGMLAIPLEAVYTYCRMFNIVGVDEREEMLDYVTAMDAAYLEGVRKKYPPPEASK